MPATSATLRIAFTSIFPYCPCAAAIPTLSTTAVGPVHKQVKRSSSPQLLALVRPTVSTKVFTVEKIMLAASACSHNDSQKGILLLEQLRDSLGGLARHPIRLLLPGCSFVIARRYIGPNEIGRAAGFNVCIKFPLCARLVGRSLKTLDSLLNRGREMGFNSFHAFLQFTRRRVAIAFAWNHLAKFARDSLFMS